jgi:hypothetical protein
MSAAELGHGIDRWQRLLRHYDEMVKGLEALVFGCHDVVRLWCGCRLTHGLHDGRHSCGGVQCITAGLQGFGFRVCLPQALGIVLVNFNRRIWTRGCCCCGSTWV